MGKLCISVEVVGSFGHGCWSRGERPKQGHQVEILFDVQALHFVFQCLPGLPTCLQTWNASFPSAVNVTKQLMKFYFSVT